jgi:hypothetical protein
MVALVRPAPGCRFGNFLAELPGEVCGGTTKIANFQTKERIGSKLVATLTLSSQCRPNVKAMDASHKFLKITDLYVKETSRPHQANVA